MTKGWEVLTSRVRTMKVFDCQDMSDDVKSKYFRHYRIAGIETYNGSYLGWDIADEVFDDESSEWAVCKKAVDAWLITNGANAPKFEDDAGEEVLIRYWW
jgi:hypothetical protein